MARSPPPKFGDWDSEGDVQYSAYFEKARKDKGGRKININDAQSNTSKSPKRIPPVQAPPFRTEAMPEPPRGLEAVRSAPEQQTSRVDAELRRPPDSPLRNDSDSLSQHQGGMKYGRSKAEIPKGFEALAPKHKKQLSREDNHHVSSDPTLVHDAVGHATAVDWPLQRHAGISSGDTPKRHVQQSAAPGSVEHSPLHPRHQARLGGRQSGAPSPSWERKSSSEGGSHGLLTSTPGRLRPRLANHGDETPEHGTAVPKFGDWDETNPSSADGYSAIFSKMREERHAGAGRVPVMPTETNQFNAREHYTNGDSKRCCCFPWSRK